MAKTIKLYRSGNELNSEGSVFEIDGRLGHKSIREIIIFKNKTIRVLNLATNQDLLKNVADAYQILPDEKLIYV